MKKEKKKNKNLVSVTTYAELCNISKKAVYDRIKSEEITAESITYEGYPTMVIDKKIYPPQPAKTRGRKMHS